MREWSVRERLLDVREVAEYLGVSERTVWQLRSSGRFAPCTRIGRRVVWRESVLEEWLSLATEETPGRDTVSRSS